MVALLTLDAAKQYLRVTVDDDDELITRQIEAASAYVVTWIKKDFGWTAATVPADVQAAVAIKLIQLYDDRKADAAATDTTIGYPPANIADLLYRYRDPTIA
jgi:uncharacterized phage protein (predicted DNA packaging)